MKDQITEIVGRTWFSFEEDRETYFLRSREYGDVCEEEPGKQDIEEAKRLMYGEFYTTRGPKGKLP